MKACAGALKRGGILVDDEIIRSRLERLRGYLRILGELQRYTAEEFSADPIIHGAAERYLQLSIESLLDIGSHLIADAGYRAPETYAGIFDVLAEQGIIPRELHRELEGMAGFRALLVHDYLRTDLARVRAVMTDKLPVLEKLAETFSKLV